jgi:hypothetical protein
MTTTKLVPVRSVGPGEVFHPGWCSPDHCQVREPGPTGKTHESARVAIGGLTVSVCQSVMACATHPVVVIETDPSDDERGSVIVRLHDVPAFTKALLEFYCRLP